MSQKFKSELELQALNNATTDTDKFLVSDGGIVKYRTGAEMLSDLGVAPGVASNIQHQVKAGVAINKGQAVYVTSADGTNMIVGLASNASEATSSKTMGLLDATVAINGFANVVAEGLLSGLNTSTANAGDPVWLGTGGNLIYGLINKPYAPAHLVFIGIVTRVNANNGEIFVKVQNGFELNEIHDVDLKTTTPVNGHVLGFDGTLWVNKTIAGWLGYTPYNASNPAGYISSYTETDTLASVTARGATTSVSNVQFNDGATFRRNTASGQNVHTNILNNGGGYSSVVYIGSSPGADWLIGKDAYGAGNDKFQIGSWNGYSYIDITYNATSGTINFPNNNGLTVNGNTIWHSGNDGSGSGLDADTVDGVQADSIVYGNARGTNQSITNNNNDLDKTGYYTSDSFATKPSGVANWMYIEHIKLYNDNTMYQKQLGYDTYDDRMWVRTKNANTWSSWKQIWTSDSLTNLSQLTNGPGYITGYTETDTLQTVTTRGATTDQQVSFTKTNDHAISVGTVRGRSVNGQSGEYIHLYDRVHIGSPSGWGSRNAPSYGLSTYGGADFATDTGFTTSGGSMRAPIFYDSDNTNYYTNPAGQSVLNSINTGNSGTYNLFQSWTELNGAHGFFSGVNGAHFYPNNGSYGAWRIAGSRNGYNGLEFDGLSNGLVSLMIGLDSNRTGFHNNSYGWQMYWLDGTAYIGKSSYGGGTTATLLDSVNFTNYAASSVHTHTFDSLSAKTSGTGTYQTSGDFRAPIFYDSDNTGYYTNPSGYSNLNTTNVRRYYQATDGVPTSNLGDPSVTEMALFGEQFNNKTAFYNHNNLSFWTSSDGVNFTEYTGFSTTAKKRFLGGDYDSGVYIPNLTNRFRIELENSGGYVFLNQLYMYWSSNSHSTKVHIWVRRCDNNQWYQWTDSNQDIGAWPGHLYLPFSGIPFYPGSLASTGHYNRIRIEFIPTWSSGTYSYTDISLNRMQIWGGYPAGKRNIYTIDEDQNITFPETVYANSSFRSPVFYDSNDTSYYADLNATSDAAVRQRGGTLHGPNQSWSKYLLVGGDGRQNYINNTETASVCTTDGNLHIDAASGKDLYLNYYDGNNIYLGSGSSSTASSINNDGSHRPQIIYDYNNTGYYLNPDSTSNLNALNLAGDLSFGAQADTWITSNAMTDSIGWNNSYGVYIGSNTLGYNSYIRGNGTFTNNTGTHNLLHADNYTTYTDPRLYRGYSSSGDFQTLQSTAGTVRFDQIGVTGNWSNAPGGYTYGGALSLRGDSFGMQLWGSHTGDFYFKTQWNNDQYSGWREVLHSANYTSFAAAASHTHTFDSLTSKSSGTGTYQTSGDFRAPVFYDSNDTNYYLDPSGAKSLRVAGGLAQNNLVGRPYAVWGAGGSTSGPVVIKFPGDFNNYGMIHAEIDVYEYSGNAASTIIVGGHNWNGSWYSANVQVIGQTDKPVRLGFKDGKYCIVIGDSSSSWSYGQVVLRKIQNGSYYNGVMDVAEGYTIAIESDSYTNISSDLRNLRTPLSFTAGQDIRTPIFYDLNNTGYYVDPSSTSYISSLTVDNTINGNISGLAGSETLATVTGRGASTSTFSNFNGGLTAAKTSKSAYGIQIKGGYYGAPRLQLYDLAVDGNAYLGLGTDMSTNSYEFSNYFPRYSGMGRWSVGSWAGDFGSGQYVSGYNEKLWINESASQFNVQLTSTVDMRAPIFYDSNNTGFYVNPAGSSNVNRVFYNDYLVSQNSGGIMGDYNINGTSDKVIWTIGESWPLANMYGLGYSYGNGYGHHLVIKNNGSVYHRISFANEGAFFTGTVTASGSSRAPIFYDTDNTSYYVDPASGANLYDLTISGASHKYLYINPGNGYEAMVRYNGGTGSGWYVGKRTANQTVNNTDFHFYSEAAGMTVAGIDTGGNIFSTQSVRTGVFYDLDDTSYFVNPASSSKFNNANFTGNCSWFGGYGPGSGPGLGFENQSTFARMAFWGLDFWDWNSGMAMTINNGYVLASGDFRAPIFYDSDNTSYYFDGSNTGDSIRCAGDIVAYYSDERLKDKKGNIENALEKVLSLNGFYYEPNEVAQSLGYKKRLEVGVSAQEVEAVLPEIIKDAPIGGDYKTLDYGKLTPLLIEAVKEQQKQIEELKELVNKLINK